MARRKKRQLPLPHQAVVKKPGNGWMMKLFAFIVSSGILVTLLGVAYQYLAGNVYLEFVQPIGRAYEFQLKNDTPSDLTVRSFRIDPPRVQKVIYQSTEDMYATIDNQGRATLPGGNVSYVPAAEFRGLDGQRLPANSPLKFRVPPLSNRSWLAPAATIVDVRYELASSNSVLSTIEFLLDAVGIRARVRTVRYLVIDNYWTISQSASIDEAIRVFCRENEAMEKSSVCVTGR